MAYSLALENKIYEAESYLNRLQNTLNIENINRICLKATRGLISLRKGFIEEGRRLYYEAIEETKSIHHKHLHMLAILNYAREELLSKNKTPDSIINLVKEIPDKTIYRDVNKIRNDVLRTYSKLKT